MVVGGGATGCEVAYHLAKEGSAVTIVEMLSKIGGDLESITKRMLIRRLKEMKVNILAGWKLVRIKPDGVSLVNQNDEEHFEKADRVVVSIGIESDDRLYRSIASLGYEIHRIGDCLEPRTAKAALYESAVIGRKI